MDNLLSVTEAASLAQVGRQYIKDEIWRGNLSATKIGNQYVISRADFEIWMQKPRRGSRSKDANDPTERNPAHGVQLMSE